MAEAKADQDLRRKEMEEGNREKGLPRVGC